MEIAAQSFGEWLLGEITAAGESQAWLARQVGVSPSSVSRWINGEDLPSEENCRRIARAINRPEDEVRERAGYPPVSDPAVDPTIWTKLREIERELPPRAAQHLRAFETFLRFMVDQERHR